MSDKIWDPLVDQLAEHHYAILDHFLPLQDVILIRDYIMQLQNEGQFKKAGIGKLQDFSIEKEVRGDFIHWLAQNEDHPLLRKIMGSLIDLQNYLNRTCFLGLKSFETHLTSYPAGTFYKIHKDRFRHHAHRVISFVLYLNPDWDASKGGELVIYPEGQAPVTILPQAGRLAVFKSELDHEVKVCHAQRYSMTGWMLDTLPGTTFL